MNTKKTTIERLARDISNCSPPLSLRLISHTGGDRGFIGIGHDVELYVGRQHVTLYILHYRAECTDEQETVDIWHDVLWSLAHPDDPDEEE